MEPLPAQLLAVTAHIVFGIINMAIPNILAWAAPIVVFLVAAWARLCRIFEPSEKAESTWWRRTQYECRCAK